MRQAVAILVDSYRELRSRSLFWIALVISIAIPVLLFGLISFDSTGWRILWFDTNPSGTVREGSAGTRDLLSWLFGSALLWWWLTWGAILVALIATSSSIPEFIASGSIDVVLAKPLSRFRLLLVKVLGVLLFMLLQAVACVGVAYLLLGLRFDMWFHGAWLAVPLVALQFLYVFAVMAFIGLVTRSTLASLILVLLFWGFISIVQFAANQVEGAMAEARTAVERSRAREDELRGTAAAEGRELSDFELGRIETWTEQRETPESTIDFLEPWERPIEWIEMCVPKTGDIQKIIADHVDAPTLDELVMRLNGFDPEALAQFTGGDVEAAQDMQHAGIAGSRAIRTVNPWASIGSSLAFTAVVIGLATIVFVRRDF